MRLFGLIVLCVVLVPGLALGQIKAAPAEGIFFPTEQARKVLNALDEGDEAKAKVPVLQAEVDKYQRLYDLDEKLLQAQDELLKIREQTIQAQKDQVEVLLKKNAQLESQAHPGWFRRLMRGAVAGLGGAGGAVIGSLVAPPVGTAVGAMVGATIIGSLW